MRIISWNVNGFRSVVQKGAFRKLLETYDPDVILLQEIKCSWDDLQNYATTYLPGVINEDDLNAYTTFVDESRIPGRHGVGMFVRNSLLDEYEHTWFENMDPFVDNRAESRFQVFRLGDLAIMNTYSVNVRTGDLSLDNCRVPQRKDYDSWLYTIVENWRRDVNCNIIMMGDFNVVSQPIDYHGDYINPMLAGMTDQERKGFRDLIEGCHMVDTFRYFHPEETKYSYWSYRGYARDTNRGWRIDYGLVSEELLDYVEASDILTDVWGSDHAPILLDIREVI